MPCDQDVTLLPETEQLSVDPQTAAITRVRVVRFTVGPHGPFTLQIPVDRYDADVVHRLIGQQAEQVRKVHGIEEGKFFPPVKPAFSL